MPCSGYYYMSEAPRTVAENSVEDEDKILTPDSLVSLLRRHYVFYLPKWHKS